MDAKSTPEERRASLERFRAVGQTFADGIASFRDRISTTTSPPNANVPAAPGVGMASENQGGNSQPANETSIENDDNADPQPIQRDVERLQNILFATERRVEAAAREIDILRAENRSLANSHERATRALESVRKEHDTALARASEERGLSDRSSSEIARLRGEVAELERELKRRDDALAVSESRACEDRKRASALERVSMSLRRRVAIAEENFTDASKVQEAIVARESAESNLVEARADAERWRARATAVDSLRDRATRAEQGERDMRQRGAILEREISSRDALIKQGLAERKKLKEFMVKYEQQLDAKDKKVDKLRSLVRNYQTALGRKDNLSDPEFSESGSARSLTWDKDIVAGDNVGAQTFGDWEDSFPRGSRRSIESESQETRTGNIGESMRFLEASPLLREVEEAHAELQAAFQEPEGHEDEQLSDGIDLVERVKRLEASFGALSKKRVSDIH